MAADVLQEKMELIPIKIQVHTKCWWDKKD